MQPLSAKELKDYLIFKSSCHRKRLVFSDDVFKSIHHLTQGNLRKINKLMDRCLYASIASNNSVINSRVLMLAADDLHFKSFFTGIYRHHKAIVSFMSIFAISIALFLFLKGV